MRPRLSQMTGFLLSTFRTTMSSSLQIVSETTFPPVQKMPMSWGGFLNYYDQSQVNLNPSSLQNSDIDVDKWTIPGAALIRGWPGTPTWWRWGWPCCRSTRRGTSGRAACRGAGRARWSPPRAPRPGNCVGRWREEHELVLQSDLNKLIVAKKAHDQVFPLSHPTSNDLKQDILSVYDVPKHVSTIKWRQRGNRNKCEKKVWFCEINPSRSRRWDNYHIS